MYRTLGGTVLIAAMLSPFTVHAFEIKERPKVYLAAEYGQGSGSEIIEIEDYRWKGDTDVDHKRLTLGFLSHSDNRFEISYVQQDLGFESPLDDETLSGFSLDGVITVTDYRVRPFIRLGLGYMTYEGTGDYIEGDHDLNGFAFNFGAGLLFEVLPQLELDIGYHDTTLYWEDLFYTDEEGTEYKEQAENNHGVVAAAVRFIFR